MNEVNFLKEQAKEYLDNADERVIKMVHAMLEVNAEMIGGMIFPMM